MHLEKKLRLIGNRTERLKNGAFKVLKWRESDLGDAGWVWEEGP